MTAFTCILVEGYLLRIWRKLQYHYHLAMAHHYLLDFQNDGTVGHHLDLETVLVNFIWGESHKFCCFLDMVCVVLNPQATVFLTTTPLIFGDSGLHLYKASLAPLFHQYQSDSRLGIFWRVSATILPKTIENTKHSISNFGTFCAILFEPKNHCDNLHWDGQKLFLAILDSTFLCLKTIPGVAQHYLHKSSTKYCWWTQSCTRSFSKYPVTL